MIYNLIDSAPLSVCKCAFKGVHKDSDLVG